MQKTLSLLFAACLLFIRQAGAQDSLRRACAAFDHLQQQLRTDPQMAAARQNLEAFTQTYVQNAAGNRGTSNTVTIPVVVHVLYNTATQNISDAQVQSQIDALNRDYQLLNADAANVPAVFAPLKADCGISFCLARTDMAGNATTGIIRKQTSKTIFSSNADDAKYSSTGGDDAWNRDQYLNLWVIPALTVDGRSGFLGYAQFPGGPAATDGVVIINNCFGTIGTVTGPFNKGRTTTHEVGHWLNLNHIWGDDNGACTGSDNVGDTPDQGAENYGYPGFPHISCSNSPNGDLFMNYMDYTDDACMCMFSNGQKARMLATLNGPRATLLTAQACTGPNAACAAPSGLVANFVTQNTAVVSWNAVAGAATYTLRYKAATSGNYTVVGGLAGTTYTLPGLAAGIAYTFQVAADCGSGSSAYASSGFTTVHAPCTDDYESNNTMATAAAIPLNTLITARIGVQGDEDYYQFSTAGSASMLRLTLDHLPASYGMKLYNSSGTLLGETRSAGTSPASLIYVASAADVYYVYVYGDGSNYSASQCYDLLVQEFSGAYLKEHPPVRAGIGGAYLLFPNPAQDATYLYYYSADPDDAVLTVQDQSGRIAQRASLRLHAGDNQVKVDVSSLPAGIYFLKLQTATGVAGGKLLVQQYSQ